MEKRSFCFAIKYSFLLYLIVIARRQDSDGISPIFNFCFFFVFLFYVKSFVFCVVDKLKSDTALPTACSYTLYPSLSNGYEKKPHLGWRWAASAIVAVGSKKNTQRCRNDSKWKFIVILAAIILFPASFLRGGGLDFQLAFSHYLSSFVTGNS